MRFEYAYRQLRPNIRIETLDPEEGLEANDLFLISQLSESTKCTYLDFAVDPERCE